MKYLVLTIGILSFFTIKAQDEFNPCLKTQSFHIAVLGSSTAAGSGPSSSDSAWVNRYRKFLQTINPSNQLTNFAVGGTTTYHIMPSWFNSPAGRPSPGNNNVSAAIQLGVDAIIVNMPSNDASNNFGLNEQMHNFIAIAASADSSGIPVWVCTTQPKNYSNSAQIQIQTDVRDSILNYFGDKAIDFWTTIANPSNTIDSLYDSGDGTHLNDAAHRILMQRVKGEDLLSNLYDTLAFVDHAIADFSILNPTACGDSNTVLQLLVTNLGAASNTTIQVTHEILDLQNQQIQFIQDSIINGVSACEMDTLRFEIATHHGSNLQLRSYLVNTQDSLLMNDTSSVINITTSGLPTVTSISGVDTICNGDTLHFQISTSKADTLLWYNSKSSVNSIGGGQNFTISGVKSGDSLFAQAIKGDLHFKNSLFTTANSNVNWNGVMFDLVAYDSITIDSLSLKLNSPGNQGVEAYYRLGSHKNFTSSSAAWSYWGLDSVYNAVSGSFYNVSYSTIDLEPGDTLAVYIHLENGGSTLSYENNGNETTKSTSELEIISGTGVAHTFGTTYFPRYWNGSVYYHFGFNPNGECASERVRIPFYVNEPMLNIGPNQTIKASDSIILDAGAGFTNYSWFWSGVTSGGSNGRFFTINSAGTFAASGSYNLWIVAVDSIGCMATDTISIQFINDIGLAENELSFEFFPNPGNGDITVRSFEDGILQIVDIGGKIVSETTVNANQEIRLETGLPAGVYKIILQSTKGSSIQKLVVDRQL